MLLVGLEGTEALLHLEGCLYTASTRWRTQLNTARQGLALAPCCSIAAAAVPGLSQQRAGRAAHTPIGARVACVAASSHERSVSCSELLLRTCAPHTTVNASNQHQHHQQAKHEKMRQMHEEAPTQSIEFAADAAASSCTQQAVSAVAWHATLRLSLASCCLVVLLELRQILNAAAEDNAIRGDLGRSETSAHTRPV